MLMTDGQTDACLCYKLTYELKMTVRISHHIYKSRKGNLACSLLANPPGAVAQSDARPPGMQTVTGSILTSGNILLWRLVKGHKTPIQKQQQLANPMIFLKA